MPAAEWLFKPVNTKNMLVQWKLLWAETYGMQKRLGSTPLFGLYRYVPLNRGCFARSWALNRLYNFTIKRLEQGVFLDWKPFEECEDFYDERCTFAVLIIFFLNFYFTILVWKIIKFCMQNKTKQGQKVVPSLVLNIIVKWAMFVLNGVGVWRPRWHSFTQSLWSLFWS